MSSYYDETGFPPRYVTRTCTHLSYFGFEIRAGRETNRAAAELDRLNVISIDTQMDVRPDSMALLWAAREVVEEPGFQEVLDSVRKRVDAIERLHRTRELTVWIILYVGAWLVR